MEVFRDLKDTISIVREPGELNSPGYFYFIKFMNIRDIVYNEVKELFGEMRDLTEEEREAYREYIKSISKPTGINIWELLEDESLGR